MATLVVSDDPMVRPETIAEALDPSVTIESVAIDSPDDIIDAVRTTDAVGLVVDVSSAVPASVFERCDTLEIVARAGVGVENIAVKAAAEHGVTVVNVPDYCMEEVSTHAVSMLLASLRRLKPYDRSVADGEWDWTVGVPIPRLADETIGFLSFGGLAKRTAEKLSGFDCELVAADPYVESEEMATYGVRKVSSEELPAVADHLSIHAPLTPATRGMIDRDTFERMSDTGVVVNVGRGGIIDETALVEALDAGEIAGAAVDVLESEPPETPTLAERDDVIVTPHAAFYSEASLTELNEHVGRDIAAVLAGERPDGYIDPDGEWL